MRAKYKCSVDGKPPERVEATSPINAAKTFSSRRKLGRGSIVCVVDKWGRELRYHIGVRPRNAEAAGRDSGKAAKS